MKCKFHLHMLTHMYILCIHKHPYSDTDRHTDRQTRTDTHKGRRETGGSVKASATGQSRYLTSYVCALLCVCMCVRVRVYIYIERERERERARARARELLKRIFNFRCNYSVNYPKYFLASRMRPYKGPPLVTDLIFGRKI